MRSAKTKQLKKQECGSGELGVQWQFKVDRDMEAGLESLRLQRVPFV